MGRVGLKFTNFSVQNLFKKGYKRAGFIPQGDGQTLSLQVQSNGTYYQNYSLSFLEPWLGGKRPNQLSFSISYSKQSDVNSNYINQNYYTQMLNYTYGYGSSSNYYTDAYDPDKYVRLIGLALVLVNVCAGRMTILPLWQNCRIRAICWSHGSTSL